MLKILKKSEAKTFQTIIGKITFSYLLTKFEYLQKIEKNI